MFFNFVGRRHNCNSTIEIIHSISDQNDMSSPLPTSTEIGDYYATRKFISRNFFLIICLHFESLFFVKISKINVIKTWNKIFLFQNIKKAILLYRDEWFSEVRFSFFKMLKKTFCNIVKKYFLFYFFFIHFAKRYNEVAFSTSWIRKILF